MGACLGADGSDKRIRVSQHAALVLNERLDLPQAAEGPQKALLGPHGPVNFLPCNAFITHMLTLVPTAVMSASGTASSRARPR